LIVEESVGKGEGRRTEGMSEGEVEDESKVKPER
jgi:hypothetical protein